MKKLHLHVRTVYFNEIKAGTKTTEFRATSPFWIKFFGWQGPKLPRKRFEGIVIYNAYRAGVHQQIHFRWSGIRLTRILHPHFGTKPVTVFAIDLVK